MKSIFKALVLATACAAMFSAPLACAQDKYPSKPVKIVVPYSPGGTNDVVARLLAQKLQTQTGQSFIVENKAGASSNIGADAVAKSQPDGYTLVLVTTGHTIAPSLYASLPYDITKDLTPISTLVTGPMLVLTNSQGPLKSMTELIVTAKAKPGQINYGSAGNGSTTHLAAELIATTAGVKFNHIPYKGSTPAMTDVMAGNADMVMDLMFSSVPFVKGGKLRAIAVTSSQRVPELPDVPTLAEVGMPGLELAVWNGLMAPAKTPKDVIAMLNTEIGKAMASPEIKERLASQGFAVLTGSPEQFSAQLKTEIDRWTKAVKASGAKAE